MAQRHTITEDTRMWALEAISDQLRQLAEAANGANDLRDTLTPRGVMSAYRELATRAIDLGVDDWRAFVLQSLSDDESHALAGVIGPVQVWRPPPPKVRLRLVR